MAVDLFERIVNQGPFLGPVTICFLVLWYFIIRPRWKRTRDTPRALLTDKAVILPFVLCVIGLSIYCSLYYLLYHRYVGLPPPFENSQIGILIAEIPGDTNREKQQSYAQAIRLIAVATPDLSSIVQVRLLERLLPSDSDLQHAQAIELLIFA